MTDKRKLAADAKRWLKQEQVWDNQIYATAGKAGSAETPDRRVGVSAEVSARRPVVNADPPILPPPPTRRSDVSADPTKAVSLAALYAKYKDCQRCILGQSRIKIVFGVGNPESDVLFIGEGPGYEEDRRGEPFVGKSGQLLDKMMAAIGLSRQTNAYIANIVKCHPMTNPKTPEARGNDRPPTPDEVQTCSPILLQQIAIMRPRVIMTLGSPSTKMILHTKDAITGLRGKMVSFDVDYFYLAMPPIAELKIESSTREALRRTQVIPTYHPAALLRNPNLKVDAWTDLKLLRDQLKA